MVANDVVGVVVAVNTIEVVDGGGPLSLSLLALDTIAVKTGDLIFHFAAFITNPC